MGKEIPQGYVRSHMTDQILDYVKENVIQPLQSLASQTQDSHQNVVVNSPDQGQYASLIVGGQPFIFPSLLACSFLDNGSVNQEPTVAYSPEDIPDLIHVLKDIQNVEGSKGQTIDKNWRERRDAAQALGEIGAPSSTPALIEALLNDPKWKVCNAAGEALAKIGKAAEPDLIAVLKRPSVERPEEPKRDPHQHALRALDEMGSPSDDAKSAIIGVVKNPDYRPADRKLAIVVLAKHGSKADLPVLLQAKMDPDAGVKHYAEWAIKKIEGNVIDNK